MAPVVLAGTPIYRLTGPLVLGYMWSCGLYGVLLVQTYMYSELFPNDRAGLKALVWVMFFFETLFTVLMTIGAWSMFGAGWGDADVIFQFNWSWGVLPLLSGVHSGLAQGFYIWRIWHLTKQLWIPVPIALAVLAQLTGLWWFSIKFNIAHWRIESLPPLSGAITVWLIGSAVCDVLITLALTGILWRHKRENKYAVTSGIMNRLIRMSIETGALTSVTAIVEAVLWPGWQRFYYHFVLFLILGKLYSNVLMATLNCRNPIFQGGSQAVVEATSSIAQVIPSLQPAFWSEPDERVGVTGVKPVLNGVHIARNVRVEHSSEAIVMTNFNNPHRHGEKKC
ncbi:putative Transmembrane protein [Mycena sanguinolenta]|uniref:Putative Transmembrane protein n=1 Tax=Mycena sanguinolenta TaxID=230812 RepID=A0A8H7DIR8_9AGAR|nr:putative Transmembrane protein [Mycena sanguinolenta]